MSMLGNLALGAILAGLLTGPAAFAEASDLMSGSRNHPLASYTASEKIAEVRDSLFATAGATLARLHVASHAQH